jgi:hypothetical protein
MANIYSNYREKKYLDIRGKWEPWYNHDYNSNHDSQNWILERKKLIASFLSKSMNVTPNSILDVGGDRGQYIPDFPESKKYVLEMSNKNPVSGVTRLTSLESEQKFNLILYSHVLEHVADPILEINKLLDFLEPNGYLYIEIPFGVPQISSQRKSRIRFLYTLVCSFNPKAWAKFTTPATGRSDSARFILKQSEHLTFFNSSTLESISMTLGMKSVTQINTIPTPDLSFAQVIQCLLFKID